MLLFGWLAVFAGVAWLTGHPEATVVERARRWPLVGPLAAGFRKLYPALPTVAPAPLPTAPLPEVTSESRGATPVVWVPAGTTLRAAPEPEAEVLGTVAALANLSLLARRGDWFQVRYHHRSGWVFLEGYTETSRPPLGSAPEPVLPLPERPPDPERLAFARSLLGPERREGQLGPYRFLTDLQDPGVLLLLDRRADQLEEAYVRRYGLTPVGEPAAVVVLFARRRSYLELAATEPAIADLGSSGHTSRGLVALYREELLVPEVAATLVHELTHLLNRRALGPALPPWLDEGMADDLGEARSRSDGALLPGTVRPLIRAFGPFRELHGGAAGRADLRAALRVGRLPPVRDLVALDWDGFKGDGRTPLRYAESSALVRYLLDPGSGLAVPFRAFLAGVAAGEPPTPERLRSRLMADWEQLDRGLAEWIDGGER